MEILLEDYKRKLKTANELISSNTNNGSIMDEKRAERLNTKASEYRSFIVDIERAMERTKLKTSEPHLPLGDVINPVCGIMADCRFRHLSGECSYKLDCTAQIKQTVL